MNINILTILPLLSLLTLSAQSKVLVKDGDTVAFMGDSITQQGASSPSGYVSLVESGLAANGIGIKRINAGISGHKSNQMLGRLQKQVLDKKADWMTLSCGVNDVWHGAKGVTLDDYKKNITAIVDQCEQAGVKVMILTSTPIKEEENELNTKLADYNKFLRELAKEKSLPLAELNEMMWQELKNPTLPRAGKHHLTSDGVHMNPFGDTIMAEGVLRAFGLNDAQITKAKSAWQDVTAKVRFTIQIPLSTYLLLAKIAEQEKSTLDETMSKIVHNATK